MKTIEEWSAENAQLREKLERSKPGCTQRVVKADVNAKGVSVADDVLRETESLRSIENNLLRAELEAACPGCSANVASAGTDFHSVNKERDALNVVKAALGSLQNISARGTAVEASYQARGAKQARSPQEQAEFDGQLEIAVARKILELGVTDQPGKGGASKGGDELSLTQKCLKALGKDINEKVAIGADSMPEE